jgi:hypothetical protein
MVSKTFKLLDNSSNQMKKKLRIRKNYFKYFLKGDQIAVCTSKNQWFNKAVIFDITSIQFF